MTGAGAEVQAAIPQPPDPAIEVQSADESGTPASVQEEPENWDAQWLEVGAIADLLIDDRFAEARDKALKLLAQEGLPEEIAARTRDLLDKARVKLARSSPEPSNPELSADAPADRAQAGVEGAAKDLQKPGQPQAVSFQVQTAVIGSGFRKGARGQLRISEAGLAFLPHEKGQEAWSIAWADLKTAAKDDGLWDVPYPVLIQQRGGKSRYVVRVDEGGRYLPGDPLLSAIAEGRRKKPAHDAKDGSGD